MSLCTDIHPFGTLHNPKCNWSKLKTRRTSWESATHTLCFARPQWSLYSRSWPMGKGNRFRRGGKQPLGGWLRLKVRLTLLLGWRLQLNKTWLLVKGKALLALLFSSSSQESLSLSPACCPPHFRPPLSKYWFQANSTPLNYWLPKTHTHDCTCHHFRNKTLQVLLGC